MWALNVDRPDIGQRNVIYKNLSICSKHFLPSMYNDPTSCHTGSRLMVSAIPSSATVNTNFEEPRSIELSRTVKVQINRRSRVNTSCQTYARDDVKELRKTICVLKATVRSLKGRLRLKTLENQRLLTLLTEGEISIWEITECHVL